MSVKGRLIASYKGDWEPTVLIEESSWGNPVRNYSIWFDNPLAELHFRISFPNSTNKPFWLPASRIRVGDWYCDNPSARSYD